MNVAFIGANLKVGGGITVGSQIIKSWLQNTEVNSLFAILPDIPEFKSTFEKNDCDIQNVWWLKDNEVSRNSRMKMEINGSIRSWLIRNKIDIIFNATNFPVISPPCKQVMLLHRPYLALPTRHYNKFINKKDLIKILIEKKILKGLKSNVDHWVVQTNFIKEGVKENYNLSDNNITVVPGGYHFNQDIENNNVSTVQKENSKPIKILYPTRFYNHKNLEILSDVATNILKKSNRTFKLILTLSEENEKEKNILNQLAPLIKRGVIINVGVQPLSKMPDLYRSSDILFMPTFLETFGLPYIEGMSFGLPIVTSDKDFSREICGEAALYFNPYSSDSIANSLVRLMSDHELYSTISRNSSLRFKEVAKSWDEVANSIFEILLKQQSN